MIDCTAAGAAPCGSCSPIRRATMAVVDRLTTRATEKTSVSIDSVRPTAIIAFAPRRATQKTLATVNSDSMNISSTIGMASRITARLMEPSVKSCCVPRMASRIDGHIVVRRCSATVAGIKGRLQSAESNYRARKGPGAFSFEGIRRRPKPSSALEANHGANRKSRNRKRDLHTYTDPQACDARAAVCVDSHGRIQGLALLQPIYTQKDQ